MPHKKKPKNIRKISHPKESRSLVSGLFNSIQGSLRAGTLLAMFQAVAARTYYGTAEGIEYLLKYDPQKFSGLVARLGECGLQLHDAINGIQFRNPIDLVCETGNKYGDKVSIAFEMNHIANGKFPSCAYDMIQDFCTDYAKNKMQERPESNNEILYIVLIFAIGVGLYYLYQSSPSARPSHSSSQETQNIHSDPAPQYYAAPVIPVAPRVYASLLSETTPVIPVVTPTYAPGLSYTEILKRVEPSKPLQPIQPQPIVIPPKRKEAVGIHAHGEDLAGYGAFQPSELEQSSPVVKSKAAVGIHAKAGDLAAYSAFKPAAKKEEFISPVKKDAVSIHAEGGDIAAYGAFKSARR